MTFEGLVDRLVALYDVTQTRAVAVANERLSDMVARSTALRTVTSLGTTVADQESYALAANVVKILQVQIEYADGAMLYEGAATLEDLWAIERGDAELTPGSHGVVAIEADSDSTMTTDNLRLSPAPGESGKAITGLVAIRPATLTYSSATALPIPVDHHKRLLAGCKAELSDEESRQDEAGKYEAQFEQGVKLLEASVTKRGKGSGRHRIRVAGYDLSR